MSAAAPLLGRWVEPLALRVWAFLLQGVDDVMLPAALLGNEVRVLERHGASLLGHGHAWCVHLAHPCSQLVGVRNSGRQCNDPDVRRKVNDDFLPHRPAKVVLQVVHFVHHDHIGGGEALWLGVQHVAQHFGGHHHSGRVAIDRVVAGQQANVVGAEPAPQITKLLIR